MSSDLLIDVKLSMEIGVLDTGASCVGTTGASCVGTTGASVICGAIVNVVMSSTCRELEVCVLWTLVAY
jgi:hypothetical protein